MNKISIQYVKNACVIFTLIGIMLYPVIAYSIINHIEISYLFTSIIFVLPVLSVILSIRQKWLYCLIVVLLTFLSLVDLTMVNLYHEYLLPGGIISTIQTNSQEAIEFYRTNLYEILHWLPVIVLCVISCWLYRPFLSWKKKFVCLFFCITIPSAFIAYKLTCVHSNKITLHFYLDNRIWNRPPFNVPFQLYNAQVLFKYRRMLENMKNIDMGAYRNNVPNAKQEIYVFAIGESLRYRNLSLNGKYSRSTTPRLESYTNLLLFDDYYSQACLTMFSVPMLITRATADNFELNYAERSIIEPFRECGFNVYTIVNQTNLLSYEYHLSDGVDSLIIVPNIVKDGEIVSGDKTIVQIIDSLADVHDKLFVMCEFLGNHSFFTNYEKEFEKYNPNSNNCSQDMARDSAMLNNAYDNSILYTDYILSSIIESIKRRDVVSALMFVSDHGEKIGKGGVGHGGDCAPIKDEYHVPYIFWWSDSYAESYPEKICSAITHKQSRINGDNMYYTLCGMADIMLDSTYSKPSWDILSTDFQEHQRLIIVPDGKTTIKPDED